MPAGLFLVPEAPSRFRTLELVASVSCDHAAVARLSVRAAVARGAAPGSIRQFGTSGTGGEWEGYTWRVWWEPPSRWRGEVTVPGGQTSSVSVVRDAAAFVYLPGQQTMYTNEPTVRDSRWEEIRPPAGVMELPTIANRHEVFPLLHSPLPASKWDFETLAQGEIHNGRVTRRVRATRRAGVALHEDAKASGYWWGVDEYECLVDDALQILVRLVGISEGVPVGVVSADEVRIDAPIPADIFAFAPPARHAHRTCCTFDVTTRAEARTG